jgi:hypothetical protein
MCKHLSFYPNSYQEHILSHEKEERSKKKDTLCQSYNHRLYDMLW